MSKKTGKTPFLVSIFGTLWITAVVVAFFVTGFIVDSDGYWITAWIFAAVLAVAPFFIFAIADDLL